MTLYDAIFERHSVRDYIDHPLLADIVDAVKREIDATNKESGLHIQLAVEEPLAFKGIKSYGKFHGVNNYIIMAGKKKADLDINVGYYGERLILFLQTLGLNSCWVGMTYGKTEGAFCLDKDEKVCCVIAFGYGKTQGARHKIKTVNQVSNASAQTPEWFRNGVEAALLAPTALNQQKFFFEYAGVGTNGRGLVRAKKGFSLFGYTKMDLGIAMLHFELGAGKENFCWID